VHDRRSIHVRLTEKGIKLRDSLIAMHRRHAAMLSQANVSADDFQAAVDTLRPVKPDPAGRCRHARRSREIASIG
jgi:DNA-binding MarR family transcriptional regulator